MNVEMAVVEPVDTASFTASLIMNMDLIAVEVSDILAAEVIIISYIDLAVIEPDDVFQADVWLSAMLDMTATEQQDVPHFNAYTAVFFYEDSEVAYVLSETRAVILQDDEPTPPAIGVVPWETRVAKPKGENRIFRVSPALAARELVERHEAKVRSRRRPIQ